jgi:hypothetical protein
LLDEDVEGLRPDADGEAPVAEPAGEKIQEHVNDWPAVEPGDQQHPTTAMLSGEAVGEEVPLPEDRHERGEVGIGGLPDLHHR